MFAHIILKTWQNEFDFFYIFIVYGNAKATDFSKQRS